EAFQQLLYAAHVMQEHNARLKKQSATQEITNPRPVTPAPGSMPTPQPPLHSSVPAKSAQNSSCRECGHIIAAHEPYCANCGTPTGFAGSRSTLQKNWASLWEMHHTEPVTADIVENSANGHSLPQKQTQEVASENEEIDLFPAELEEIVARY